MLDYKVSTARAALIPKVMHALTAYNPTMVELIVDSPSASLNPCVLLDGIRYPVSLKCTDCFGFGQSWGGAGTLRAANITHLELNSLTHPVGSGIDELTSLQSLIIVHCRTLNLPSLKPLQLLKVLKILDCQGFNGANVGVKYLTSLQEVWLDLRTPKPDTVHNLLGALVSFGDLELVKINILNGSKRAAIDYSTTTATESLWNQVEGVLETYGFVLPRSATQTASNPLEVDNLGYSACDAVEEDPSPVTTIHVSGADDTNADAFY